MDEYEAHEIVFGSRWTTQGYDDYLSFMNERRRLRNKVAIHHIDGNPYNNDPDNLRIVDMKESER